MSIFFPTHSVTSRALVTSTFALMLLINFGTAFADTTCSLVWQRTLKVGMIGDDVLKLQQMLNANTDTMVALTGPGSPGSETSLFGALTARAVSKFQTKFTSEILTPNGLSTGTGIFGPSTRAKLNSLCVAASSAPQTISGTVMAGAAAAASDTAQDVLTLSDPGQPPSTLAPFYSSSYFLSMTLSAGSKDVTVNDITVERIGFGADAAISSVALFDEDGLQVGVVATLNAEHKAKFRRSFTIPANTSRTFDVYANMAGDLTNYDGQTPQIQVTSINASSPLLGTLPLKGTPQTVNNSLVVGGALGYLSGYDPDGDRTQYVNDKGVKFSGIRITANSLEDLEFATMIWTQSGTVGNNDLENVVVVVDGKSYPTEISPYSTKEYVAFFEPAITIAKGRTVDMYIQGDLKPSAGGRNVRFDIYDTTDDIGFLGKTYGFGVGISPGGSTDTSGSSKFLTSDGTTDGTTLNPFFQGSTITVSNGAVISVTRP